MKLTKEQLQRIIKEELSSIKEGWTSRYGQTSVSTERPETEKIPDVTGFFSGPGFDDEEEEELTNNDIIAKAEEIKSAMSPREFRASALGFAIEEIWKQEAEAADIPDLLPPMSGEFHGWDRYALERLYDEVTGESLGMGETWEKRYDEGKQKMKLTKEQLKRIIKEELGKVMSENEGEDLRVREHINTANKILELIQQGQSPAEEAESFYMSFQSPLHPDAEQKIALKEIYQQLINEIERYQLHKYESFADLHDQLSTELSEVPS